MAIPEAWHIVAVETHPAHRGRGLATDVTAGVVAAALEQTSNVSLTVVCDNAPAIRVYEKLGFRPAEKVVWIDCGAGSSP